MALLLLVLALVAGSGQTAVESKLLILSPGEDDFVSGAVTIVATVTGGTATYMTFYADGRVACRLGEPPWQCRFDAGEVVKEHHIRIVAELTSGTRLTAARRTKAIDYAEAAEVDAVIVPVTVRRGGRFVRGLRSEDFSIREDGRPQQITMFAPEGLALELAITMDVSGSMDDDMPEMREAVKALLTSLRPQDKSIVAAFNTSFFIVSAREASEQSRRRAVDRLASWGGTALYDALVRSADLLQKRPGRKAIIVFTDGDDQSSRTSAESAERRMESSDAVLYVIGQGHSARTTALRNRLTRLAEISGGRAFFTGDITELRKVFDEIVEDLANQYALWYSSDRPADNSWRRIDVAVRSKGTVRARQGYRAVRTTPK
ncbi:MAG TPA: VWA domain-containing protein [Vicinamibacterales bacterium]|nr:VWA domain-containing protein [Vicinamibacterales bacterium]